MVINSMHISKAIKSMSIKNQVEIPRICICEKRIENQGNYKDL
jgi:hypothetical protein